MLKEVIGGKLYLAPIGDNPQKIIDLGTGFGEWAIESMSVTKGGTRSQGETETEGKALTRSSGRDLPQRAGNRR